MAMSTPHLALLLIAQAGASELTVPRTMRAMLQDAAAYLDETFPVSVQVHPCGPR